MDDARHRRERESDERHARGQADGALAELEYRRSGQRALDEKREKIERLRNPPDQNDNYSERDDEPDDEPVGDPWADDDDTFVYRGRGGKPHRHKTFEARPKHGNAGMHFRPEHHLTGAQHAHAARREMTRNLHYKK